MKKYLTIPKLILFSTFFISCNSYQLASYFNEGDGIYLSTDRGIDYEEVFNDYVVESLNTFSSDDSDSNNLPWGANPDSSEVVSNFFPNFGRFYYDPFFHNMAFNPFFANNGMFINYGFRPPFFYNSFAYEMGYPFYGPLNFYFSPYATSLGNYYWYMMRSRRYMPWNYRYGGIYDTTVYKDQYNNIYSNSNRVSFSNSASRRGEDNSTSSISRKSDNQGVKISGLYSRTGNYGGVYTNRTRGANDYDVYERNMNRTEILNNNLTGVYSRSNSRSINTNRNNSIPNLSKIKSDYVKEAYRQVRSVNPSQRGNPVYRSSSYDYSNSPSSNYFNNRSSRTNSSYRGSSGGSRSSGAVQARSFSSQSGGSRGSSGGSRGSSGGSRGSGNIN
tara:strand:+ start:1609 stop:2772 length:1164 start_codon:yes stop_codon:yes gene_type:complete